MNKASEPNTIVRTRWSRLILGTGILLAIVAIGAGRTAARATPNQAAETSPQKTAAMDLDRRLDVAVNGTKPRGSAGRLAPEPGPVLGHPIKLPDRHAQRLHESKASIVLGLLGVTVVGGALLSLLFHSKLAPLPVSVMALHVVVTTLGFALLLVCVYGQIVQPDDSVARPGSLGQRTAEVSETVSTPYPIGEKTCHLPSMSPAS